MPLVSRHVVVAVDGPSGSGKSSVSRRVALELHGEYLDTGAMYRAVTLWFIERGLDPRDELVVRKNVALPSVSSFTDPRHPQVHLDGVDVSERIRAADVTAAVSYVSAVPEVRHRLVGLQRAVVALARSRNTDIVVEGRDVGHVVLPAADLKVFLTADVEVRAARRHLEELQRGADVDAAAARSSITDRDAIDTTRTASPLAQPADAFVIDATHLDIDAVVAQILALVESARAAT